MLRNRLIPARRARRRVGDYQHRREQKQQRFSGRSIRRRLRALDKVSKRDAVSEMSLRGEDTRRGVQKADETVTRSRRDGKHARTADDVRSRRIRERVASFKNARERKRRGDRGNGGEAVGDGSGGTVESDAGNRNGGDAREF